MARKQAREAAMKLVYEWSMGGSGEGTLDELLEGETFDEMDRGYIGHILRGVKEHKEQIDNVIAENAIDWKLERMAKVDVAILRLALYEILYDEEIPYSVSIQEAVKLAVKYGNDKSASFINGLLGKYVRTLEAERV